MGHIEKINEKSNLHKAKAEELQMEFDKRKKENDTLEKEVDQLQKKLETKNKTMNDFFQRQKKEIEEEKVLIAQQNDLQAQLSYLEEQTKKHVMTSNTSTDSSWSDLTTSKITDPVLKQRTKDIISLITDLNTPRKDLKSRLNAVKADSATHEELSQIQIKQLVQQVTGHKSLNR